MKVAHINVTYGTAGVSGTEQSVPNTCALLEARGIETCVIYERSTGPEPMAPRRRTQCLAGIAGNSATSENNASALQFLEDEKVDIVHVHQATNLALVREIKTRWPVFLFIHNHVLTCPSGIREFRRPWRECPQAGPAPTCVTNAYLRRCNSRRPSVILKGIRECLGMRQIASGALLGVDSDYMRQTLVRSGFPVDRILVTATVTGDLPEAPASYPAGSPPSLLHVSALTEIKGTELLLDALTQLPVEVGLNIAGDGYYREVLERRTRELGLRDRVRFLGQVGRRELFDLLRTSRMLVVTSRYPEPFGLVGPEAMASSRPVVAFSMGGIPEWLDHDVNGILVRPEDPDGLARAIRDLLSDPGRAEQMGAAGRVLWEQRFRPDAHIDQLVSAYRSLTAA